MAWLAAARSSWNPVALSRQALPEKAQAKLKDHDDDLRADQRDRGVGHRRRAGRYSIIDELVVSRSASLPQPRRSGY
ncbi:hypothetical protein [Streptosporangium vulgare]|uniref:hypothetical protein n=1 Tax=Streptosporangium vulgare TaxID=46190 RepID=UPI0031D82104